MNKQLSYFWVTMSLIEPKVYMNDHVNLPYKNSCCCIVSSMFLFQYYVCERVSDYCFTPNEQFFSYIIVTLFWTNTQS